MKIAEAGRGETSVALPCMVTRNIRWTAVLILLGAILIAVGRRPFGPSAERPGALLAFTWNGVEGYSRPFTLNPEGGRRTLLPRRQEWEFDPASSPDGTQIAF